MKRVLVVKTSLDGHWRGVSAVARALSAGGFEVIYGGELRASEVAQVAADEDADLIGLNIGGRVEVVERILAELESRELGEVPVFAGGTLTPQGVRRLETSGIRCFPPGSSLDDIVTAARDLTGVGSRSGAG